MSIPMRVNETLFREAEAEGALMRRSAAKQVEFWAELGKTLSRSLSGDEILALMQGVAQVRVDIAESETVDPQEVFRQVDESRESGALGEAITAGRVYYEVSEEDPDRIEQVREDGSRRRGRIVEGHFKPE